MEGDLSSAELRELRAAEWRELLAADGELPAAELPGGLRGASSRWW